MDPEGTQPPSPGEHGSVDESTLAPMGRDWRFVIRLVLLLAVGLIVALFVGAKLQHAAAGCGASLVRPGSTVIPPR